MSKETNEKESEVKVAEDKHPLMKFVPIVFNSFEEWLARWNGTEYLYEKLGLLHSLTGWSMKPELVSLLLSVADGCADESFADDRGYNFYGCRIGAEGRKSIAKKAFSVLCLKFFRSNERNREPLWWWMLGDEVLFQKILWFLRLRSGGFNRLCNHSCICDSSSDHQQGIFRNFLREFSRLGWDFRCPESRKRQDEKIKDLMKQRLVAARPKLIYVLRELGELSWLNSKDLELDVDSIRKLTEMALGDSLLLPPEKVSDSFNSLREPKNLREAALGGSVAAEIVLLHQIKERERKHIKALYEASVRQHDDEQKATRLDSIEKEKDQLDMEARNITEESSR